MPVRERRQRKTSAKLSNEEQFDGSLFVRVTSSMLNDLDELARQARVHYSMSSISRSDIVRRVLREAITKGVGQWTKL